MKFEINAKWFYIVGKYAFFVSGLIGLIRIVDLWSILKSYDIFSSLSGVVFNFVLSAFFSHLQGKEEKIEITDPDIFKMNDALDKLNIGGNNAKTKRRN
jgi:hypothetical protein